MVAPPAAAAKVADPSRAVSQLRSLLGNARTVRSQFGAQSTAEAPEKSERKRA